MLLSRAVNIYLLARLGSEVRTAWRHVLFWGGLRGPIALALVPESTDESWARQVLAGPIAPKVSQLMMAVIQAQDLEDATFALTLRGIPSTVVRSSGGFLDQRNHVLFVIDAAHCDQL